jgi:two-component system response regulator PilR (NtrC family)
MTNKILVIDDEPDIRQLLSITLHRMGFDVDTAENVSLAYKALESDTYILCITDLRLPDGSGLDIVTHITDKHAHTPVIVVTAHGSMDIAVTAMKLGAFDFINKPFDLNNLRQLINNAVSTSSPKETNALDNIIGQSSPIHLLKEKIIQVSRSQAPVFITGESGSGKEVVANAIHTSSSRKGSPFIAINCGAIPRELMESEFFGHKKGSFTGAHQDKQGLFQAADGGTLLLDEIADLPLEMQVKLLRVIQEKSIRPIGSSIELPVDVRIISATHQNLLEAVNNSTFRSDLYYRLNVIDIFVPPLRDKLDDIPLLSDFILEKIARQNNNAKHLVNSDALHALQTYTFPGNIRELENILERACALANNQNINAEHLLLATPTHIVATRENQLIVPVTDDIKENNNEYIFNKNAETIDEHLEKIEKNILLNALNNNRWNRTSAAKTLGISFRSLRYRLKKLKIDIDSDE